MHSQAPLPCNTPAHPDGGSHLLNQPACPPPTPHASNFPLITCQPPKKPFQGRHQCGRPWMDTPAEYCESVLLGKCPNSGAPRVLQFITVTYRMAYRTTQPVELLARVCSASCAAAVARPAALARQPSSRRSPVHSTGGGAFTSPPPHSSERASPVHQVHARGPRCWPPRTPLIRRWSCCSRYSRVGGSRRLHVAPGTCNWTAAASPALRRPWPV
jgi:hypothetical protein